MNKNKSSKSKSSASSKSSRKSSATSPSAKKARTELSYLITNQKFERSSPTNLNDIIKALSKESKTSASSKSNASSKSSASNKSSRKSSATSPSAKKARTELSYLITNQKFERSLPTNLNDIIKALSKKKVNKK